MMDTRRKWLVTASRSNMETGAQSPVLARAGRVGLAAIIAFVAVTSLSMGLFVTHRTAVADTLGTNVHSPPPLDLFINLTASAEVVRPGTEVAYTYMVSNLSAVYTLTDVVVEDSHLGPIPPTHFSLLPGESATLTATATLTQNRTSIATATASVEGCGNTVSEESVPVEVHVIEGISLAQAYLEPPPVYHGDVTTLYYSVVNRDQDDGVVNGTVLIVDTLGRALGEAYFDLSPAATISQSSSPFTVPRDITITLTATGWDDVQGTLLVSDEFTLACCPQDVYEPDDDLGEAHLIYPNEPPQLHDFWGNEDWVRLQLSRGALAVYTFTVRPLAPDGVPISLTLHHGLTPLTHTDNLANPQLPVQVSRIISCTAAEGCAYFLEIESPASGCWTDYELWVEETPLAVPLLDLAASAQAVRPGTQVMYTYTVSNPGTTYTLTDVVVEDSHLGPISPTHFSLPPGEVATLTATATLTQNRTSAATVTANVEGYGGPISGGSATTEVHVIEGISLAQVYPEPLPIYHGEVTTLYYSVVNRDQDDGIVNGTALIVDTLGRTLDEAHFDLGPAATISRSSSPFTVPRDITITLTATGWDDVQGVVPVSDEFTLACCPQDVYEPDNNRREAHLVYPNEPPQLHDFWGDEDWARLQLSRGALAVYTFNVRPLALDGVPISLTLHHGLTPLTHTDNLTNPQLPVQVSRIISCTAAEGCAYFLEIESPASGCWTDYELWVEETPVPVPLLDLAASAQAVRPGIQVMYTYTVSNPSTIYTLTDVVVEDSHLGPISPTHFSLPPGEEATLTATATLTQNRTSAATVTANVEGYGGPISGGPATTEVHVIEGISLAEVYSEPPSVYYGDVVTLHYSVVNRDQDDGVADGSILIYDTLGRTLGEARFDLGPGATTSRSSSPFTVPCDIAITLVAIGWDHTQRVVPVSDRVTLALHPDQRRVWLPIVLSGF